MHFFAIAVPVALVAAVLSTAAGVLLAIRRERRARWSAANARVDVFYTNDQDW